MTIDTMRHVLESRVVILMATYNGQKYLSEQLDSIEAQSYPHWDIWASDDGSDDDSGKILEVYRNKWAGRHYFQILAGPQAGFVANFLGMACKPELQAQYYAFADQDDVWEADKLQRAVNWFNAVPEHIPALYCSRTRLINEKGEAVGYSPLFRRSPGFANALVQNIAGGNTMVFNHAALLLLQQAGPNVDVVVHDWWVYLVVSGCGGQVYYDSNPSLRYRQHQANLIGSNRGWRAAVSRLFRLMQGSHRDWNDRNIAAIQRLYSQLPLQNRRILDAFIKAREGGFILRLINAYRSGIYRQTVLGRLSLCIGVLFNRI